MPFTISHIIAVVPIVRLVPKLPLSALAIGAMVPDLTLFFPLSNYHFAHSLLGLLLFCLPWGLLVYGFFEAVAKHLFIACLPLWAQYRLVSYREQPLPVTLRSWYWAAMAVTIGALTHVVWDSFTHAAADTFVRDYVEYSPSLAGFYDLAQPVHYGELSLPVYKYLQYISSVVGLALVLWVSFTGLRKQAAEAAIRPVALWLRWAVVALHVAIPMAVFISYGLIGSAYFKVSGLVIDSMTVSIVFWVFASLIYWLKVHKLTRS